MQREEGPGHQRRDRLRVKRHESCIRHTQPSALQAALFCLSPEACLLMDAGAGVHSVWKRRRASAIACEASVRDRGKVPGNQAQRSHVDPPEGGGCKGPQRRRCQRSEAVGASQEGEGACCFGGQGACTQEEEQQRCKSQHPLCRIRWASGQEGYPEAPGYKREGRSRHPCRAAPQRHRCLMSARVLAMACRCPRKSTTCTCSNY